MDAKKYTILIVDDENDNLELLERSLRREYKILKASNGQEGLTILEKEKVDMIITDQRMPQMTGVEMLTKSVEEHPDVVRMILTGYTDVDDLIDAINQGHVYRYITKPWEPRDLRLTVQRALESYQLGLENKRLMEDLVQAEKLATVGKVTGGIAHEIKNQLVGIMFAELIKDKYPNDAELQNYVQYILDAYSHILNMVDEIRSFAKQAPPDYSKEYISFSQILDKVLTLCRFDKKLKLVKMEKVFEQEIFTMMNREKIKQVLLNLIKNAAEALDDDRNGKVTIGLKDENGMAALSISDNGVGISAENLARIWEPFFTTKGENGTGLGLDICRKIIEAHKGTITVVSTVGVGTTFTVRLPILKN